jgi:hypothetical protein
VVAVVDRREAAVDEADAVGLAVGDGGQLRVRQLVDATEAGDGEAADHVAVRGVDDDHLRAVERGHQQADAGEFAVAVVVLVVVIVLVVVVVLVGVIVSWSWSCSSS